MTVKPNLDQNAVEHTIDKKINDFYFKTKALLREKSIVVVKTEKLCDGAQLPQRAHESDFCFDVVATSCKHIGWRKWQYGIGLAFEMKKPEIFPNLQFDIDFRPRSSVHKTGMILSNCIGTLDELYRGEVKAIFYRVTFGKRYKVGDRIGQIAVNFTLPTRFEEVEKVDKNTERGTGGFGSTGR